MRSPDGPRADGAVVAFPGPPIVSVRHNPPASQWEVLLSFPGDTAPRPQCAFRTAREAMEDAAEVAAAYGWRFVGLATLEGSA